MALGTILLIADEILTGAFGLQQWGIFSDGEPIIEPDTYISFDYKQTWTLSDYPLEGGAFETYDKVQTPFDARFRVASGGSDANRQALLDSIAAIAGDTNTYDIVTPEEVYPSVNVAHYDYRRTSTNGLGLITIDIWLIQVRITAMTSFTQTQSPSAANPVSAGQVQPAQQISIPLNPKNVTPLQ